MNVGFKVQFAKEDILLQINAVRADSTSFSGKWLSPLLLAESAIFDKDVGQAIV